MVSSDIENEREKWENETENCKIYIKMKDNIMLIMYELFMNRLTICGGFCKINL